MVVSSYSKNNIYFMPLGGGQTVGASSYFLKLGYYNIILDAGIGFNRGLIYDPNYIDICKMGIINSMEEIDQVFISHAHLDHVGALNVLSRETHDSTIYMSRLTKLLTEYQLMDKRIGESTFDYGKYEHLITQDTFDKIHEINFLEKIWHCKKNHVPGENGYYSTFFPAGHIPGASMFLFEYMNKKILYTGDFSIHETALTEPCMLPVDLDVDLMIMCALHIKKPYYNPVCNKLDDIQNRIMIMMKENKCNVTVVVTQLSKGIEFIKAISTNDSFSGYVYIDPEYTELIYKLETANILIMGDNCRIMRPDISPRAPYIYVTPKRKYSTPCNSTKIQIDFSLHDNYRESINFIKKINPKTAILVHCASDEKYSENDLDFVVSRELLLDPACRTQVLYAEDNTLYSF